MNNKIMKKVTAFILIMAMLIGFMPINRTQATTVTTLGDVPIGSIVTDPTWNWEHKTGNSYTGTGETKPIDWLVVSKDHYGDGQVTVITNEIIGKKRFSTSSTSHWGDSNSHLIIRPWLNTIFYDNFGMPMESAVIKTELPNKNFNGIETTTYDNVFLPSETEVGGTSPKNKVGTKYEYFTDNASRVAKLEDLPYYYYTRSPAIYSQAYIRPKVGIDGRFGECFLNGDNSHNGVRPVINLKSDTLVEHIEGNKYELNLPRDEDYFPSRYSSIESIRNLDDVKKYGSWANGYYGYIEHQENYKKFNSTVAEMFGTVIDSDQQRIETILPNGWVLTVDNYGMMNWHKEFVSDQPTTIPFDGNKVDKIELGHLQGLGTIPLIYTKDGFIYYIDPTDNQVRMLPTFQNEIKGTMVYHEKSNNSTHFLFVKNDGSLVSVDNNRMEKVYAVNMDDVGQVIPSTHARPDYFLMKDGTMRTLNGDVTLPGGLVVTNLLSNRFVELSDGFIYTMNGTSVTNTNTLSFMVEGATNDLLRLKNGQIMKLDLKGTTSYINDVNGKLVKSIVKIDENSTFILMLDNTTKSYGDMVVGDLVAKDIDYTKVVGFLSNNTGGDMLMMLTGEEIFNGYQDVTYGRLYDRSGLLLNRHMYSVSDTALDEIINESNFTFDPTAQIEALIALIEKKITDMVSVDEAEEIQNLINKVPPSHQTDKDRLQEMLIDKIKELTPSVDSTPPTLSIEDNPTQWTNKSITLKVISKDEEGGSGVKDITLPDGKVHVGDTTT